MSILSYLGRVNIAVRLVTEKYPGAQLYEVDGVASKGPTTKPLDIDQLRVVFGLPNNHTALISSTGWGEFGPIEDIPEPWLEDVVIPWPIKMDLVDADRLLKAAGFTGPYYNVTLRHPLYPGVNEPEYIFCFGGGRYIAVGVLSKKVFPVSVSMQVMPEADAAKTNAQRDKPPGNPDLTVAVGHTFELKLKGNRTTGYSWVLAQMGASFALMDTGYTPDQPIRPGSGGTQVFTFLAMKANGGENIVFQYLRPWPPLQPVSTSTWCVVVKS